jgi:hypothetical protein
MSAHPRGFRAFWPHYLMAHREPKCRALHFIGSTGAALAIVAAILTRDPLWLPVGLVFAYAMAWTGHFAFEGNRPATFGNPLWSLAGDVRMYLLWLTFRLEPAVATAESAVSGSPPPGAPGPVKAPA